MAKILTHDGRFHADDVIACELLSLIEDGDIEIVRSRILDDRDQYKWIIDVGREYTPEHGRFDHHQEECAETWPGCPILLSSSGMVFLNLWKEILEKIGHPNATWEEADMIYKKVFLPIDAHDNGQIVDKYQFYFVLKYGNNGYSEGVKVGQVIANMNHDDVNSDKQNLRFADAMKYAFDSFIPVISTMVKTYRSNKKIIELLKDKKSNTEVLVLPKGGYVNNYILKEIDPKKRLLFTVYEKKEGSDGQKEWGFSTIQDEKFTNRADLVTENKEKYPNLIFIHKKLFCGSSTSKEEAIQICIDSVKQHRNKQIKKMALVSGLVGSAVGLYYLFKD